MSAFFLYFNDGDQQFSIDPGSIGPQLTHFPGVAWKASKNKNLQIIYTENKSDTLNIFPDVNDKLFFIIHGQILQSEGGIPRIDRGDPEYSIQHQIRKRYEQGGIDSCTGLNGQYNLLVWDQTSSTLQIAGDRLGIHQLFYTSIDHHRFALTTDISTFRSIPGYSPKISRRGIFDLLYIGIPFEERTVLEGVTRLIPYSCYQITKAGLKLIEEKQLPFSKRNWDAILPTLIEELERKYSQAIGHSFTNKDKILFMQTGGKDSRLYSHFLKKAGLVPQCITAGETHHNEVFLAHEVSRALGFPWKRMGVEDENGLECLIETFKLDSFSRRTFPSIGSITALNKMLRNYDFITGTFIGDAIIGNDNIATRIKLGKNAEESAENYLGWWRRFSYTDSELHQLFSNDTDDLIHEYKKDLSKLLPRLAHEPFHQLSSLEIRANCRFKVGGVLRQLAMLAPLRLPCLDNDLMDFTLSIPPALFCQRLLIDLFLIKKNQTLAAIPLDQNSLRGSSLYRGFKQELKYKLWSNYIEKIKFPFLRFSGYPFVITKQTYIQIFSLKETNFQQLIKNSLKSISSLEGLLDVKTVEQLLNRPLPDDDDHIISGSPLRSLITVIEAAKTFNP